MGIWANYIADKSFVLPECTATDMNFYVKIKAALTAMTG